MTLSELLEELKGIDPETADDIGDIVNVISIKSDGSFSSDAYYPDFIIQGCIQRACERRGWGLVIERSKDSGPYEWSAYTGHEEPPGAFRAAYSWGIRYYGGSAAEALLAAYVAAIKEEKR